MHLEPEIWSVKPQNEKCINNTHAKISFCLFSSKKLAIAFWNEVFFSVCPSLFLNLSKAERDGASHIHFFPIRLFFRESIKAKAGNNSENLSKYKCNFRAWNTSTEPLRSENAFFVYLLPQTIRKLVFGVYLNSRTCFKNNWNTKKINA